jgi:hypothetical protein
MITNFFKRIFMFFFKPIKRFSISMYLEQLKVRDNYKKYLIRAVGPYCGYKPEYRASLVPNLTTDVVTAEKRRQPFLLGLIVIRYIIFYVFEFFKSINNYPRFIYDDDIDEPSEEEILKKKILQMKIKKLDS